MFFSTGYENEWTLEFFINEQSTENYIRKFEQTEEVTNEVLHLVSWSDLIATLQFSDTKLPSKDNEKLKINIANGLYRVVVKQLFDCEDYEYESENKVNFIVELFSQNQAIITNAESIVWTENWPNDETVFLSNLPDEFDDFLDELIDKK